MLLVELPVSVLHVILVVHDLKALVLKRAIASLTLT